MAITTLNLDQSISCSGVVIMRDKQIVYFECIKTKPTDGSDIERISVITNRIIKLFEEYSCDHIICEQLSYGSVGNATRTLAGLLFSLEVKLFEEYNIDTLTKVTPTELKKFATGHGKASKKGMLEAVPEEIREKFFDNGYLKSKGAYDLADAYHIGMWWFNREKS